MSKISFNNEDIEIFSDKDFLLKKKVLTDEVISLFKVISEEIKQELIKSPNLLWSSQFAGKISKGQYYKDLPYIVSDYPRRIDKNGICLFRIIFLWGREFSCNFLITGDAFRSLIKKIENNLDLVDQNEYSYSIEGSPWEHSILEADLNKLNHLKNNQKINTADFIKISRALTINRYENLHEICIKMFRDIIRLTL